MTGRSILVESDTGGLKAALIEKGRLQAIEIDRGGNRVGAVMAAKVVRTIPALGTTIKLNDGTELLLDRAYGKGVSGEKLIAQVIRVARGEKAGIATQSVALSSRGLIHLPFESGIKISRRLDIAPEKRTELESVLSALDGGWIVRRNAAHLIPQDLKVESDALAGEGRQCATDAGLPAPDAFRRLIGDYGAPESTAILVSGLAAKRAVERWCRAFAPSLESRIEAHIGGLFDQYDLDEAVAALAEPRCALPGGGSLVIEPTEALTVIDVNAGAKAGLLNVNLAAALEIARQLRLRHIGGIVVIDFISMTRPRDEARVVEALKGALADDPAQTHVLPMSAFGLVEMTRQRRGPGLEF